MERVAGVGLSEVSSDWRLLRGRKVVMSAVLSCLQMLGRVSDSVGRVAMLKLSCLGSMLGALGSLYATGKWSFVAAR